MADRPFKVHCPRAAAAAAAALTTERANDPLMGLLARPLFDWLGRYERREGAVDFRDANTSGQQALQVGMRQWSRIAIDFGSGHQFVASAAGSPSFAWAGNGDKVRQRASAI